MNVKSLIYKKLMMGFTTARHYLVSKTTARHYLVACVNKKGDFKPFFGHLLVSETDNL